MWRIPAIGLVLCLSAQARDWGSWTPASGDSSIEYRLRVEDRVTCVITYQMRFTESAKKVLPDKVFKVHYIFTFAPSAQGGQIAGAWYGKPADPPDEKVISLDKPACPALQSYHALVESQE